MEEIKKNDYNLNILRFVSITDDEKIVDLAEVKNNLDKVEEDITTAKAKHNQYLKELGLPELP